MTLADESLEAFDDAKKATLAATTAATLGVSPDQVAVAGVRQGSVVVALEVRGLEASAASAVKTALLHDKSKLTAAVAEAGLGRAEVSDPVTIPTMQQLTSTTGGGGGGGATTGAPPTALRAIHRTPHSGMSVLTDGSGRSAGVHSLASSFGRPPRSHKNVPWEPSDSRQPIKTPRLTAEALAAFAGAPTAAAHNTRGALAVKPNDMMMMMPPNDKGRRVTQQPVPPPQQPSGEQQQQPTAAPRVSNGGGLSGMFGRPAPKLRGPQNGASLGSNNPLTAAAVPSSAATSLSAAVPAEAVLSNATGTAARAPSRETKVLPASGGLSNLFGQPAPKLRHQSLPGQQPGAPPLPVRPARLFLSTEPVTQPATTSQGPPPPQGPVLPAGGGLASSFGRGPIKARKAQPAAGSRDAAALLEEPTPVEALEQETTVLARNASTSIHETGQPPRASSLEPPLLRNRATAPPASKNDAENRPRAGLTPQLRKPGAFSQSESPKEVVTSAEQQQQQQQHQPRQEQRELRPQQPASQQQRAPQQQQQPTAAPRVSTGGGLSGLFGRPAPKLRGGPALAAAPAAAPASPQPPTMPALPTGLPPTESPFGVPFRPSADSEGNASSTQLPRMPRAGRAPRAARAEEPTATTSRPLPAANGTAYAPTPGAASAPTAATTGFGSSNGSGGGSNSGGASGGSIGGGLMGVFGRPTNRAPRAPRVPRPEAPNPRAASTPTPVAAAPDKPTGQARGAWSTRPPGGGAAPGGLMGAFGASNRAPRAPRAPRSKPPSDGTAP